MIDDATALRLVANALEQHKQTLAEYENGVPEPALDNAGDTLDVSITALSVIANDIGKAREFAETLKSRSPDQFKWLASEEATDLAEEGA